LALAECSEGKRITYFHLFTQISEKENSYTINFLACIDLQKRRYALKFRTLQQYAFEAFQGKFASLILMLIARLIQQLPELSPISGVRLEIAQTRWVP
jgi:hypothetical protein